MTMNIKKGLAAILMAATLLFASQGCFFGFDHGHGHSRGHHHHYHHDWDRD